MSSFLKTKDLAYVYTLERGQHLRALKGINLNIKRGEFVALVGPNGSGKSTLARHFNGLLSPTEGEVLVDGLSTTDPHQLQEIRRKIGMVFQNPENQFVASTVEEDVAFGPENLALPPVEIRQRVEEALRVVGLSDYRNHPPQALSGGQKQLLAIAGVLANHPSALILDEPNVMLDSTNHDQVLKTLLKLHRTEDLTILLITHDMSQAIYAERILVIYEGQIIKEAIPSTLFKDREGLQELGLEVPVLVEIAHYLQQGGIDLPPDLLTVDDLVGALC